MAALKRQPGQDILVYGSADLIKTLMRDDLIDTYRMMVFPLVVGSDKRLFGDSDESTAPRIVATTSFSSGVVVLTYESVSGKR